ncbi:DUF948 domain-containing protein [Bacillus sp. REN3]|uniref:DUF948 domain-containing protein n=1 Tax=Bacillus sp. REN3 TaxID=2802440 RepID=UPI001AEEF570|nr:DUF948 domain-containing protein [Bacillus sp. REN3]
MIIVYISLAVIAASLVYLGFTLFKTFKETKPAIEKMQESATRVQAKTNAIKQETDRLTTNQQQLLSDFEEKKTAVNTLVFSVKQTPAIFKGAIKVKPVAELEQIAKARIWNRKRRNTAAQSQY